MKYDCPVCGRAIASLPQQTFASQCQCGWQLERVLTHQWYGGEDSSKLTPFQAAPAPPNENNPPPADSHRESSSTLPLAIDLNLKRTSELLASKDFSKALSSVNRAIADCPPYRLPECYSLKGYTLYQLGELELAEAACTDAILGNRNDANTFAWRAAARGEQNKWRLAFDDLDAACEVAGSRRDEFLGLMSKYAESAKKHFRSQIQAGQTTPEIFCERGWVYYRRGQLLKAERDFKHALSLDITHAWSAMGLALTHRDAGVFEHLEPLLCTAISGPLDCRRLAYETSAKLNHSAQLVSATDKDLHQLHRMSSQDPFWRIQACRLRASLGFPIRSIDILTRCLRRFPDRPYILLARSECYSLIKSYPQAIDDLDEFLLLFPKNLEGLFQRANAYFAMELFELAMLDIEKALAIEPGHYDTLILQAKTYLAEDELSLALSTCQQIIQIKNAPEVFAIRAEVYLRRCEYSESLEEFQRASEFSSDSAQEAEYLYRRGAALYQMNKFADAYSDLRQSCKLRPRHAGAWVWKAATCSRLKKWHKAISSLQTAINIQPNAKAEYRKLGQPVAKKGIHFFNQQNSSDQSSKLFRYRAMAYQFLDDHENAVRECTKGLEKTPNDVRLLIQRGKSYAQLGDHALAEIDLSLCLEQQPDNHLAHFYRAQSLAAVEEYALATSEVKRAIQLADDQPKYFALLSELKLKCGFPKRATRALDRAILLAPTNADSYRKRAEIYVATGKMQRAIRDFTHALELAPDAIDVLIKRGHARLDDGQTELALADFEKSLLLDPNHPQAYIGRARILLAQGRSDYVAIWLTKAIHRFEEPDELAQILLVRGKALEHLGRSSAAASDFSAAIELTRNNPKLLLPARLARGLTNIDTQRYEKATKDFMRLSKAMPNCDNVSQMLLWLAKVSAENAPANLERPMFIRPPVKPKTPLRPNVVRQGFMLTDANAILLQSKPPYDSWILRTADDKEYGPVPFNILKSWLTDGRVDIGMKILRADWSKWRPVERVLPEMIPFDGRTEFVEDFPGIQA